MGYLEIKGIHASTRKTEEHSTGLRDEQAETPICKSTLMVIMERSK